MRYPWVAVLLLSGCQNVYSMLMTNPGDGGPPATTSGGTTGGIFQNEGGTVADAAISTAGLVRLHSGAPSQVSAVIGSDGCVPVPAFGCTLFDCPSLDLSASAPAVVASAGDIHVSGGSFAILLVPAADGYYAPQSFDSPLWPSTGVTLVVTADGRDVPGFTAQVDGTVAVDITSPILTGTIDVPRASDFTLTWTGGLSGLVVANLEVGTQRLTCALPVAPGQGVLPQQALAMLPAGTGTFELEVESAVISSVGIEVRAETPALAVSSGQPFSGAATVH